MTATKTRTRKSEATTYDDLARQWADAEREQAEIGRKLAEAIALSTRLNEARLDLAVRQPELVNADGSPIGDNEVAKIDRELGKIPDIGALQAQAEHAERLVQRRKGLCASYVRGHYEELIRARRAEAERIATAANLAIDEAHARVADYLAFHQGEQGLAAMAARDTGAIPGLEAAGALLKLTRDAHLPVPTTAEGEHE